MLLSNLLSFMKVFGYSFFQNFSENTPRNADHIGELLYKVLPVALRLKDSATCILPEGSRTGLLALQHRG